MSIQFSHKEKGSVIGSGQYVFRHFGNEVPIMNDYLTFESDYEFTSDGSLLSTDGTLEYSTDAITWQSWDGVATSVLNTTTNKYTLYFRGEGASYLL